MKNITNHNAESVEALSLFLCNKAVPSRANSDNNTRSVLLMSSLLRNFVLVAVTAENSASHRYDVGNGNRVFSALVAISGYSAVTLIQNTGRVVFSNILLRPPSFAISSSWSSPCTDMLDSPGLLTNGSDKYRVGLCLAKKSRDRDKRLDMRIAWVITEWTRSFFKIKCLSESDEK